MESIAIIVILIVIFILLHFILVLAGFDNILYPKPLGKKATPNNGQDASHGRNGVDGILGATARNGYDGINGRKGLPGKNGQKGFTGPTGGSGSKGNNGKQGSIGISGSPGMPSNAVVSTNIFRTQPLFDSHSVLSRFAFENETYDFSLQMHVTNTIPFILGAGEFLSQEYGFGPPTSDGSNFLKSNSSNISDLKATSFFSRLRILIGYGSGDANDQDRSNDTIFYISPPITRHSFLFQGDSSSFDSRNSDQNYTVYSPGNTKDFYFIKTIRTNTIQTNSTTVICYLLQGLGRYQLVVNVYPPLPNDRLFTCRIVEDFSNSPDDTFFLPSLELPFNSPPLRSISEQNGIKKIKTISPRFDINYVVDRDLSLSNVPWLQTNKRVLDGMPKALFPQIPFENTFRGTTAKEDNEIQSINQNFSSISAMLTSNNLISSPDYIQLQRNDFINPLGKSMADYFGPFSGAVCIFFQGLQNIPLINFLNSEKLYLEFSWDTYGGVYGNIYDYTLIDFSSVYGKRMYTAIPPIIGDTTHYVKMGYTTKDGTRYSKIVFPGNFFQDENVNNILISEFNIPLYGYKKE